MKNTKYHLKTRSFPKWQHKGSGPRTAYMAELSRKQSGLGSSLTTVHPVVTALDHIPTRGELYLAILSMAEDNALGVDGIPSEMCKRGGATQTNMWLMLIQQAREESSVYQECNDYTIVTIFKNGDRPHCVNYLGILLLSMAGTSFARILLNRLNAHIAPTIVPETECGFWNNRNTLDMFLCLKQIQEKSIGKQPISLCGLWHFCHR